MNARDAALGVVVDINRDADGRVVMPRNLGNTNSALAHTDAAWDDEYKALKAMDEAEQMAYAATWTDEQLDALWSQAMPACTRMAVEVDMLRDAARREWPGTQLAAWLMDSVSGPQTGHEIVDDVYAPTEDLPHFASGCEEVDKVTLGGFYGVTVIAGETGVGKSTLGFSTAIEAVRDGWTVIYINAELDRRTLKNYAERYCGRRAREDLPRLRFMNAGKGVCLKNITRDIADKCLPRMADRCLVVVDSINTIAELSQARTGGETYYAELSRWGLWAMEARKRSEGRCSFVIVAELNRRGETKGGKIDYLADLVLHLKRGQADGYIQARIEKGRYSGTADLGALYLNHRNGKLEGTVGD